MTLSKVSEETVIRLTSTQKRRIRRKRLKGACVPSESSKTNYNNDTVGQSEKLAHTYFFHSDIVSIDYSENNNNKQKGNVILADINISSIDMFPKDSSKSREDILAARAAKKLDKQKTKAKSDGAQNLVQNDSVNKDNTQILEASLKKNSGSASVSETKVVDSEPLDSCDNVKNKIEVEESQSKVNLNVTNLNKSKDEVDRANTTETIEIVTDTKSKEQIKIERAAKKAAKQAKKKGDVTGKHIKEDTDPKDVNKQIVEEVTKGSRVEGDKIIVNESKDLTVKDVVKTLKDIVEVAKEMKEVTAKVEAINLGSNKKEEVGKSKAELRAERRLKQEAQRAAKQVAVEEKALAKQKSNTENKSSVKPMKNEDSDKKVKSPKSKSVEKSKVKPAGGQVNWFQHLNTQNNKEALNKIPINSNLHPAIIKLGVQLATRVVTGSNARCIALLDALKKMVTDYTLPAKTEFARGLESHLATSLDFLWSMRQPSASQTNAVKFFRHHLTLLPNNVDEFDAKKRLQEEIDRYIREQIDMAGEAISITVRKKIAAGDYILTYECSSLIERTLREAWAAGLQFSVAVCGRREHAAGREMLRRLARCGLPCAYIDITALSAVMKRVTKVLLGASSLLVNGSVLGSLGTAQVALMAREYNVPVLVACETHKFSERVQTDAFVYNELGDPDALIDENSPLRDWRSNPNLTPLNLTYDVTPPSLVTAVITELAILPCTSAPVVLRFKLSEYGV